MLRRALALVATAVALGAAANAVHPRGLSWTRPLGPGLRARAVEAGLVPVDLAAVRLLLKDGKTLFLDSRPVEEFETGALPGARSMPWTSIQEGAVPPAPAGPVVVYCGNEWCEASLALGAWLRGRGCRDVAIFIEGHEAWWNAGGQHE
jgi:rhodanese-related sulfurtransferase